VEQRRSLCVRNSSELRRAHIESSRLGNRRIYETVLMAMAAHPRARLLILFYGDELSAVETETGRDVEKTYFIDMYWSIGHWVASMPYNACGIERVNEFKRALTYIRRNNCPARLARERLSAMPYLWADRVAFR